MCISSIVGSSFFRETNKYQSSVVIYLQDVMEDSNEVLRNPVNLAVSDCLGTKSKWSPKGKPT